MVMGPVGPESVTLLTVPITEPNNLISLVIVAVILKLPPGESVAGFGPVTVIIGSASALL